MTHSNAKKMLTPQYCEVCNFDEFFQRHRIKPGRVGGGYRRGNVIALCGNCHWRADNNVYKPRELFQIVLQRLTREVEDGTITYEVYRRARGYAHMCLAELEDANAATYDEFSS